MANLKLTTKLILFDVISPIVHLFIALSNIATLYRRGDHYWAIGTFAFLLIPGALEVVYWLYEYCAGRIDLRRALKGILLYNPILFPIFSILWHVKLTWQCACKGQHVYKDKYNKSSVLNCIHVFTTSAFQTALQATMLIVSWKNHDDLEYHLWQLAHIIGGVLSVAYHSSNHHFHAKFGKKCSPGFTSTITGFFYFLFTYGSRTLALAFLAAYLKGYFLIIPAILIAFNFGIAALVLKTDWSKIVFTSVASVTVPVCFVSKEHLAVYQRSLKKHPGQRFLMYYSLNTVVFVTVTLIAVGLLMHVFLPGDYFAYTCKNVPSTTCLDECEIASCVNMELMVNIVIWTFNALACVAIPTQNWLCSGFFGRRDEVDAI